MMDNEIDFRKTLGGWQLTLFGDRTKAKIDAINQLDFTYIVVDDNKNKDLSWLADSEKQIRELVVNEVFPESLLPLKSLERLQINTAKGEYPQLPRLRSLFLATSKAWRPSIAKLTNLEFLRVHGWPEKDISILSKMDKLIYLKFVDSRKLENLAGCEHLTSLESMNLTACSKLNSCTDLQHVANLHHLYIESCKAIADFNFLRSLLGLILLYIGLPRIPSLNLLINLPNLRGMTVGDTLVDDLNIALLKEFPALRSGEFCNKKGYNAKREDIQAFFRDKWDLKPDSFKGPNSVIGYEIPQFSLSP